MLTTIKVIATILVAWNIRWAIKGKLLEHFKDEDDRKEHERSYVAFELAFAIPVFVAIWI